MVIYSRDKGRLGELDVILRAPKEGVEQIRDIFEKLRVEWHDDFVRIAQELRVIFQNLPDDSPLKPLARYNRVDAKGLYRDDGNINWPGGGGPTYEILHPLTNQPCKQPRSGWRYPTPERFWEEYQAGRIVFGQDHTTVPRVRSDLFSSAVQVLPSVQYSYAQTAAQQFDAIFGGIRIFDNPKPYLDLARLVEYLTGPEDLIVDYFAGSGSTAHGVLEGNYNSSASRRFILVQLPEPVDSSTETGRNALSLGLRTIADITKERVRRVIKKLNETKGPQLPLGGALKQDRGFRVFKLAESNFTTWNAAVPHKAGALEHQLELHINHIRKDRTENDLLYELLLKSGFPLTAPIEKIILTGRTVHSAVGGALLLCLDRELTLELIRAMAERKPERVVLLDEGFAGNDQLKANAVQIFKTRGVSSFKTV